MSDGIPNWELILQAVRILTDAEQVPFTRQNVYEWIWRHYSREDHDRPSLDPTFQGMIKNAPGGPPSQCGTPLIRIAYGRYMLASQVTGDGKDG